MTHGEHRIDFAEIYLYTHEHVLIPRYSTGVYGSFFRRFPIKKKKGYFIEYYVIKNKISAVDKKGQRCNTDESNNPVGHCIVMKFEDAHNCTAYQLMADKTKEFCSTKKQLAKMNNQYDRIEDLTEADLASLTGCLPSCTRDDISLRSSPNTRKFTSKLSPTLSLRFLFHDGTFTATEEYMVYDTSNFLADVGGYLGLLVGQSILGIYYLSIDLGTKMKIRRYVHRTEIKIF